jgi:hypothetical protein
MLKLLIQLPQGGVILSGKGPFLIFESLLPYFRFSSCVRFVLPQPWGYFLRPQLLCFLGHDTPSILSVLEPGVSILFPFSF